jgi:hypothetical protein
MAIKENPARDTFRSHVYSKPLGLGSEAYDRGLNIQARSTRALEPIIGRGGHTYMEDYIAVQKHYKNVATFAKNEATISFPDSGDSSRISQYDPSTITIGGKTLEIHDSLTTPAVGNLGVNWEDYKESLDLKGMIDEIVLKFNDHFDVLPRVWSLRSTSFTIIVSNSQKAIIPAVSVSGIPSIASNFPIAAISEDWYLEGLYTTPRRPEVFYENRIKDTVGHRSGSIGLSKSPQISMGSMGIPLGTEIVSTDVAIQNFAGSAGDTVTSEELIVRPIMKRQTIFNEWQNFKDYVEDEWWHGKDSTWSDIDQRYSVIYDNFSMLQAYLDREPEKYKEGNVLKGALVDVFRNTENVYNSSWPPQERKIYGVMTQQLTEALDTSRIHANSYSTYNLNERDPQFLDAPSGRLFEPMPGLLTLELPFVASVEATKTALYESDLFCRVDESMLSVVLNDLRIPERDMYELSETLYTAVGDTLAQHEPYQGIIYSGQLK